MSGWDEAVNNTGPAVSEAAVQETATRYTGVSLTLKSDGAYDAPWYVIHGANAGDVLRQLNDPDLPELLKEVTKHSTGWAKHQMAAKGLTPVVNQGQSQGQQASRPAQNQSASSTQPDEPAPSCEHGPREWKDFTSSKGNHVKGWFCRTQGSDCKPLYRK